MPKGIPTAGDDYELRRLRTGYVYILAAKAECKNFEITWEAENGNAWYIYTCYNNDKGTDLSQWSRFEIEDIIEAEKPQNDISTTQETANTKKEENKPEQYADVDTVSAKPGLNTEYIELNRAIETAYIMYSEFKLPYSLLKELEKDDVLRKVWMKKIQTNEASDSTAKLSKIESVASDYLPSTQFIPNILSNLYRFAKVGKTYSWQLHLAQLASSDGVIVALDDPIGIARDLDYYVYYLDDKRQEVLAKYEYAFITAQIIDAHVTQLQKAENSKRRRNVSPYVPYNKKMDMTIEKAYATLDIDDSHLDNSEDSIVEMLKKELGITQTIHGVNTINKIAKIPNLFNTHIDNVVHSICDHIAKNTPKIKKFILSYMRKNKSEPMASLCCQYFEGLIGHLSYTSLGQQALITAFNLKNDLVTKNAKRNF